MTQSFSELGIDQDLVHILRKNGISEPTPIQSQAIPPLMGGKDVLGKAQTGTGKTLAFLLPIIEKININESFVQALIVTPTRELAIQIAGEARKYSAEKNIIVLEAYGGQDVERQIRRLKGAIHLVIGTPGRLLDHIRRQTVNFGRLKILVLDEADQMLDMGFLQDIEQIMRTTPDSRQTLLFSATIPAPIQSLASRYMKSPVQIFIQNARITLKEIRQVVIETTDRKKQETLCRLIDQYKPYLAIIFCRTKRRASMLNEALQKRGYSSDELHGDISQAKREKVMKSFKNADLHLLVATDVAARGLDIEGVTHVFNYDIPRDAESYIHRIGRTGRAGQTGVAFTFTVSTDHETLRKIENGIQAKLDREKIDVNLVGNHKERADIRVHRINTRLGGRRGSSVKNSVPRNQRRKRKGLSGKHAFAGRRG